MKVGNYSLSPGVFCFVRRIERVYNEKYNKKVSDKEMIELLKTCFEAGDCLVWYQMQYMFGNEGYSDEKLLAHLCELKCHDADILDMIEDGLLARKKREKAEDWTLTEEIPSTKNPRLRKCFRPIKP